MADIKACLYAALGRRHMDVPEYHYEPLMRGSMQHFKCRLRLRSYNYVAESIGASKKDAQTICAWDFARYLVRKGVIPAKELPPLWNRPTLNYGSRTHGERSQFNPNGPSSSRSERYQPYNRPSHGGNRDEGKTRALQCEEECRELRNLLAAYKLNETNRAGERGTLEKELEEANSKLATAVESENVLKGELERLKSTAVPEPGESSNNDGDVNSLRAELKRKTEEWSLAISLAESLRSQLNEANANKEKGQTEPSDLQEWKKIMTKKAEGMVELRYRGEVAQLKTQLNAANKELSEVKAGVECGPDFNRLSVEEKKRLSLDYFHALVAERERKAKKEFDEAIKAVKGEFNARKKLQLAKEAATPHSVKCLRCNGMTPKQQNVHKASATNGKGPRQQATGLFGVHAAKTLEGTSSGFDGAFSELVKGVEKGNCSKK